MRRALCPYDARTPPGSMRSADRSKRGWPSPAWLRSTGSTCALRLPGHSLK